MTVHSASHSASESRGCLATLAVLMIMIGIVGAGIFAQDAVADLPNQPVDVGHGVSLVPPPDWEYRGRAEGEDTILLSRGNGSLAVAVIQGTDERGALTALRERWTATGKVSTGEIRDATGAHGSLPAARFTYSGTFEELASPVEGEVTGVRGTSIVVTFDGWADVGEYAGVADDIGAIIAATTIP